MVAMGLHAQDGTGKIRANNSYKFVEMNQTLTNADTSEVVFNVQVTHTFTLDAGVNIDLVSGSSTTDTLFVMGRKEGSQAWTTIAKTGIWDGVTNTTPITSYTTAVRYREIKLLYKAMGTCVRTLDNAWLKVYYE